MAVFFDGSTRYTVVGQNMTLVSSKVGVLSVWIKPDGVSGFNHDIISGRGTFPGTTTYVTIREFGTGSSIGFEIQLQNTAGGSTVLRLRTVGGELTAGQWNHVLSSWDVANGRGDIFVNDVQASLGIQTIVDLDIGYNRGTEWTIGNSFLTSEPFRGAIDEIYLNDKSYIDITVAANRRRFYGALASQIGLGHEARAATGTQPLLFFTHGPGNFGRNDGSGGNIPTIVGAPTFSSGRPATVETLSRGWWGERWRESERSGIPFRESRLVDEPASGGLEVARREFSTDRDEINRRRRFGTTIFEF